MVFVFVASMLSVGLNAENLSKEQFNQLYVDCSNNENKNSCQRLIDSGVMASIEQCDKEICNNIGSIYKRAENYQQSLKYFKKACELNDKFGCHNLAGLYGQGQGVEQNFYETFKFSKKACDLNNMVACYNIGVSYAKGIGVRQDFMNAKKYFEKACNANNANACNGLAGLYYDGQGVKQNLSTAKKYYGKACDLNEKMSCEMYKMLDMN